MSELPWTQNGGRREYQTIYDTYIIYELAYLMLRDYVIIAKPE